MFSRPEMILMMMAAKRVVQKVSMVRMLGKNQLVNDSIRALMMRVKRPSVRITSGQVKSMTMGRMKAFTRP